MSTRSYQRGIFIGCIALCIALLMGLVGCTSTSNDASQQSTEDAVIRIGGLKGPTSMGMVKMLKDAESGNTMNQYEFTMSATADELTPAILNGELDILAVPSNLGAIMYNNSNGSVQMLAANMLGAIYVLENGDETINSIEDLQGRTIYTVGKGSTPEFILAYLLEQHGLELNTDVQVEWKNDPTEIVGLLNAGTADVVMLPEPFVTVAKSQVDGLRVALDMNAEWDALNNGSKLVTAGLIVRTEFANEHPEQLANFLKEYSESTDWVNANTEEASALIEEFDIVKAPIAQISLPNCNIVCIDGAEMKKSTEAYFKVLFDQNPEALGGSMPGDDFYYES